MSPVIGVILMLVVTVILTAVAATLVFGIGDRVRASAPQAGFSFDYQEGDTTSGTDDLGNSGDFDGTLTVRHSGGPPVRAKDLEVVGHASADDRQSWDADVYASDDQITAGEDLTVYVNQSDVVRITWSNDARSSSATLGRWRGPDA